MLNVIHIVLSQLATRVRNDDRGEVSIEYALVGGLMAVAIVAAIALLVPGLNAWFGGMGDFLTAHFPV
jgi:Flp pilus assembly pilin Flp